MNRKKQQKNNRTVAIGYNHYAPPACIAIGRNAVATSTNSIVIGRNAVAGRPKPKKTPLQELAERVWAEEDPTDGEP